MRKILSLLLCFIMVAGIITGCAARDDSDKGAIIPVYLSTEIFNFDPAFALHDEAGVKILGLLYEGLTRINDKGKMENALMKSYKWYEDEKEDYYMLQIELRHSAWSDGRLISADDVVFAWKRLLEPEFASEAASMLYEIKNARAVKSGDMTIDDLGLYAVDLTVLEVEFETKIDYMLFLENCANLALVPLREDKVVKLKDWGSNPSTMVTCGPFYLKSYKAGISCELERNVYYYRNIDKEDSIFKYITPYRFVIDFTMDEAAQLKAYEEGNIFLLGELPLSQRTANEKNIKTKNMLSTHTYVFNTTKAPFNKTEVRQALSLAIDRNEIVRIVTYAETATGIITDGVNQDSKGTSFRKTVGDLISASADMAKAKSLLGGATGSFAITIRPNAVDRAVADYIAGVWGQLGFTVSINELTTEYYIENEYDQWEDLFETAYRAGNFDVIAIDMNMVSTDVFPNLAMFSKPFSGGALDLAGKNFDYVPHVSGYASDAYDALMEEIFAIKVRADRASKLQEAERMLVNDMPVMPLFVYKDAYLISGELSNVGISGYGYKILNKTKLKNYLDYQTTVVTEAAEDEDE